jgi:hypothetical protein
VVGFSVDVFIGVSVRVCCAYNGRVCVRVFVGMSVHAYCGSLYYNSNKTISPQKNTEMLGQVIRLFGHPVVRS